MNPIHGTIIKWNDSKGFGFIKPNSSTGELFFHISSFKMRRERPTPGLKVTFEPEQDAQGRNRAVHVTPVRSKRISKNMTYALNAFFTSVTFLLIVAVLSTMGFIYHEVLWLYLGASLFAYIMYAWDKFSARQGWRRTPEATLHWIALIGGWPGALFAQQSLRHKSKKTEFRIIFWITVALNIFALAYLLSPYRKGLLQYLAGS